MQISTKLAIAEICSLFEKQSGVVRSLADQQHKGNVRPFTSRPLKSAATNYYAYLHSQLTAHYQGTTCAVGEYSQRSH